MEVSREGDRETYEGGKEGGRKEERKGEEREEKLSRVSFYVGG